MSTMVDLILKLQVKYREDFYRFVCTGEASVEFLNYLEVDQDCIKAVEYAFDLQGEVLAEIGRIIRREK